MSSGRRVVVVAVTRRGAEIARRVATALPAAEVRVAGRWQALAPGAARLDGPLSEALPALFRDPSVGGLIVVLAVGATVRLLAPWLVDKDVDPAVVAVDDAGRFAVAVLSGHRGGANALARRVATALDACPVVTTASDSDGVFAVDLLGAESGWRIEASPQALRHAAAALVNGDPLGVYQDAGDTSWQRGTNLPLNVRIVQDVSDAAELAAVLVISDRALALAGELDRTVVYRPPTLVAGVGCSLGASADDIASAVDHALERGGLAGGSLARIATLDRRVVELGVVEYAQRLGLPVAGFTADELASVAGVQHPSAIVQAAVGTPGVCEPAALLASGATALLVPKVKTARATAAIARIERVRL